MFSWTNLIFQQSRIWLGRCLLLALLLVELSFSSTVRTACQRSGNGRLQYMWGDALRNADCLGPNGNEYPKRLVESIVTQSINITLRSKRSTSDSNTNSGLDFKSERLRVQLLNRWLSANGNANSISSKARNVKDSTKNCLLNSGSRLCETEYNTTAPLFGVSMTSGETVAIVQKFPDLLQQVVYERCVHEECKLLKGECHQTYVPYLLLTVPLGPVTLTGQDYILVESGCVCRMHDATAT